MGDDERNAATIKCQHDRRWLAWLIGITGLAAILRVSLFTGFFGSDEVTYAGSAYSVYSGEWRVSNYIGALRYGVNIPMAVFMRLFGVSEFSANLWSLLCSVGEVILVFVAGRMLFGTKAAILAAIVLALLPIHVHYAGRLMADSPLAFFITLSFVLFFSAERSRNVAWYALSGMAVGLAFWVKSVVVIFAAVFGLRALACRKWDWRWSWMVAGALLVIGLNFAFFAWLTERPFYLNTVTRAAIDRFVGSSIEHTAPTYYLEYLFFDVRHTWLLGLLSLAGIVMWVVREASEQTPNEAMRYVVIWALGLIAVFSLAIVSISPVKLIFKQTNYMLMFVAPLALLAGHFLANLSRPALALVMVPLVAGSLGLAILERQAVLVFVANSKAVARFAQTRSDAIVFASENNVRADRYYAIMTRRLDEPQRVFPLSNWFEQVDRGSPARTAYAIVDLQTIEWQLQASSITGTDNVPGCWIPEGVLAPVMSVGSAKLVRMLTTAVGWMPSRLAPALSSRLQALAEPRPAYVYQIPDDCRDSR